MTWFQVEIAWLSGWVQASSWYTSAEEAEAMRVHWLERTGAGGQAARVVEIVEWQKENGEISFKREERHIRYDAEREAKMRAGQRVWSRLLRPQEEDTDAQDAREAISKMFNEELGYEINDTTADCPW